MSGHSETPWHAGLHEPDIIRDHAGRIVADLYGSRGTDAEIKANTAFIVCAVNSHSELIEALEKIASVFDDSWIDGCVERSMGDLARAALAKAKGETT